MALCLYAYLIFQHNLLIDTHELDEYFILIDTHELEEYFILIDTLKRKE